MEMHSNEIQIISQCGENDDKVICIFFFNLCHPTRYEQDECFSCVLKMKI